MMMRRRDRGVEASRKTAWTTGAGAAEVAAVHAEIPVLSFKMGSPAMASSTTLKSITVIVSRLVMALVFWMAEVEAGAALAQETGAGGTERSDR